MQELLSQFSKTTLSEEADCNRSASSDDVFQFSSEEDHEDVVDGPSLPNPFNFIVVPTDREILPFKQTDRSLFKRSNFQDESSSKDPKLKFEEGVCSSSDVTKSGFFPENVSEEPRVSSGTITGWDYIEDNNSLANSRKSSLQSNASSFNDIKLPSKSPARVNILHTWKNDLFETNEEHFGASPNENIAETVKQARIDRPVVSTSETWDSTTSAISKYFGYEPEEIVRNVMPLDNCIEAVEEPSNVLPTHNIANNTKKIAAKSENSAIERESNAVETVMKSVASTRNITESRPKAVNSVTNDSSYRRMNNREIGSSVHSSRNPREVFGRNESFKSSVEENNVLNRQLDDDNKMVTTIQPAKLKVAVDNFMSGVRSFFKDKKRCPK